MSKAVQVDPAANAALFILQDQIHEPMHDRFLWATMMRGDREAAAIPEWEQLIRSNAPMHAVEHPGIPISTGRMDRLRRPLNSIYEKREAMLMRSQPQRRPTQS